MYAPFGTGALVGRRDTFLNGPPEYRGGGTVEVVTPTEVHWADPPDRDEAGSPNVVGAVAMAAAAGALLAGDMNEVARHEASLTAYALERLRAMPGVTLYGETTLFPDRDRVGVITFNVANIDHALVTAVLGYEEGIGIRSGCFCAQPYVAHLLNLGDAEQKRWRRARRSGYRPPRPGMVRVSFGAYNTIEEVDALIDAVERVIRGEHRGQYERLPTGDYAPRGYSDPIRRFFSLASSSGRCDTAQAC
jgi:selenocysteine lyase/cysteine desulfurase